MVGLNVEESFVSSIREVGPARRVHKSCIKGGRLIDGGNFFGKKGRL